MFRQAQQPMHRLTLLLLLLILLTACAVPGVGGGTQPLPAAIPSATPDVYHLALGNIQAQATLDAMQATSQAISANLTAVAYAPTREAAETATERAWTMTGWTATASVEQTVTAASGTAIQESRNVTATQQAVDMAATQQSWQATATQRTVDITATVDAAAASAQATALHGQAVSVELAIERERMMNSVQAAAPWGFLLIAFVFVLVTAFRWSRVRPIQRDSRGDAPLLVVNGKIYDADRNPYPLVDLSGKKPSIPPLTSPELQSATTARDQMIDLATRGTQGQATPQRKAIAQQMAAKNILPAPANIQVISPEQARPLLGNAINGIVRDAIDADVINQENGEQHD